MFGDNRLIIALTKIDLLQDDDDDDERDNTSSLEKAQARICKSVKESTNGQQELLPSDILPVSGEWALTSRQLRSCLVGGVKAESVPDKLNQQRYHDMYMYYSKISLIKCNMHVCYTVEIIL